MCNSDFYESISFFFSYIFLFHCLLPFILLSLPEITYYISSFNINFSFLFTLSSLFHSNTFSLLSFSLHSFLFVFYFFIRLGISPPSFPSIQIMVLLETIIYYKQRNPTNYEGFKTIYIAFLLYSDCSKIRSTCKIHRSISFQISSSFDIFCLGE